MSADGPFRRIPPRLRRLFGSYPPPPGPIGSGVRSRFDRSDAPGARRRLPDVGVQVAHLHPLLRQVIAPLRRFHVIPQLRRQAG